MAGILAFLLGRTSSQPPRLVPCVSVTLVSVSVRGEALGLPPDALRTKKRITAAGTAQVFHLIPLHGFSRPLPYPLQR